MPQWYFRPVHPREVGMAIQVSACPERRRSDPTRSGLFSYLLSINLSPAVSRGFFFAAALATIATFGGNLFRQYDRLWGEGHEGIGLGRCSVLCLSACASVAQQQAAKMNEAAQRMSASVA